MNFRKHLGERSETVLETVGKESTEEVLDYLELPNPEDAQTRGVLEKVLEELKDGSVEKAQKTLTEEFGTVCERERPDEYGVGEEHTARCLLHDRRFEG